MFGRHIFDPATELVLGGHVLQLLAPVVAENVPATQGVQAPPDTENVPAGQGGHTVSLVAVHAEDKYFPVPQTVQEVHRLLFVPVHIELAYSPAPQPVQVVHTVWLVAVHAEVKYWG